MSKEKKSMDDVLASIRRIIKTDPTAAPPDASSLPRGDAVPDETAREVLNKLRRESEGGTSADLTGKPLSASDDPDEAARAVLEHLRKQAEAEAVRRSRKDKSGEPPAKATSEEKPAAKTAKEEPPEVETPIEEPPEVASDDDDVPVIEEAKANDGAEADEKTPGKAADEEAGAGDDAGRNLMAPDKGKDKGKGPASGPDLPAAASRRASPEAPVMIDEAALEATIRRVVRDELMGEMGRRITRNVVKLIKDEIARSRLEEKK